MRLDMIYKACILPLAQVFGLVGVDERNIHFARKEARRTSLKLMTTSRVVFVWE